MYIVIAGGGKVGSYLATVLLESGNQVAIIEENKAIADLLSVSLEGEYLVIHGQDDTNLVACEIAERVFHVNRVIARVNSPKNLRIFRKVGIECVSSTTLIANLIEEEALLGNVSVVSSLTHGNVSLSEFTIGHMRRHSDEEGVALGDIELPEGALAVAVAYEDDAEVANDDMILFPGDQVIVVADDDVLDEVRAVFRSL